VDKSTYALNFLRKLLEIIKNYRENPKLKINSAKFLSLKKFLPLLKDIKHELKGNKENKSKYEK
jgi:hypothetical protein